MRIGSFVAAAVTVALSCGVAPVARANILIVVDKGTQSMTVSVDGQTRWTWPVSTGIAQYDTPNGQYTAFRMEADHYSKEWDDAPMPHSIFFTQKGHAIHGSLHSKLGRPASHGCVRLSPEHAAELYALVEEQGLPRTRVVIDGEIPTEPMVAGRQPFMTGNAGPSLGFRLPWSDVRQVQSYERPPLREPKTVSKQKTWRARQTRESQRDYYAPRASAAPAVPHSYGPRAYVTPRRYAAPQTYAAPPSYAVPRSGTRAQFDPRVEVTEETYVNGVKVRRHYIRRALPGDYAGWR